jgi:hypothetical protein
MERVCCAIFIVIDAFDGFDSAKLDKDWIRFKIRCERWNETLLCVNLGLC